MMADNRLTVLALCLLPFAFGDNVTFIALGDWGAWPIFFSGQPETSAAMAEWATHHPVQFIQSTGDNIYPNGVESPDSRRFNTSWREMYDQESLRDLTWYISIGNHDIDDDQREWNMVEFGRTEPRWVLPSLYYSHYKYTDSKTVHFIIIDSENSQAQEEAEQLAWLEEELANSQGDWKIVVGHRPVYSVGDYGPWSGRMRDRFQPLFEKYDVDMYLCGHDHNLQHLHQDDPDIDYVISGSGGALLYLRDNSAEAQLAEIGVSSLHFSLAWGYTYFTISDTALHFTQRNTANQELYSFTRYH